MAGIKVPQYDVFKIGTTKLKYHNWNIDNYTLDEARQCQEMVSLFEGGDFRLIAQIRGVDIRFIDFTKEILMVVIDNPKHFKEAVSARGIKINGITYKRFLGTTGGLKNNTLRFVNADVIDELNERCKCGRKDVAIVPAKLEAYMALTCSASQPICDPEGILVVSDCLVNIKANIIHLDDTSEENEEPSMDEYTDYDLENNASDGFNLCTIDYMKKISESLGLPYVTSGVCLRNAWLKGMLYPFPIVEFAEKYNNGNYIVKDIWGDEHDLRNIEMILTESSLKLWKAYDSIDDYVKAYHKNGYTFSVTKISSEIMDDHRELNYQYLQSYDFTDNDIKEICAPTVKYLKQAFCGKYETTKAFLGIAGDVAHGTWQEALYKSEYMMGDPYVIESVNKMIRRKIDDAKIGKLIVDGNYQIVSGDPFSLMQHICGLEVTGLLKAGEIYSNYWVEKKVDEVVMFRSPMTSHNNIVKCHIPDNEDVNYWYQYMKTILIVNSFDTACQAENGMDYDGDLAFTTNNKVLVSKHTTLPAIICIQRNVPKIIPTEEDMIKTELDAMGNKVGTITNRVTAMMEVQSHFEKGTKEYEKLSYRIACGQLYQQNEIDKIKGIVAKPMPKSWYDLHACGDDEFLKSICTHKKPYFMIYVYDEYKKKYHDYLKNCDISSRIQFNLPLEKLLKKRKKNEDQQAFYERYQARLPFGEGPCAMNKICWYIEKQFDHYDCKLKKVSSFDYRVFKTESSYTDAAKENALMLSKEYMSQRRDIKTNQSLSSEERMKSYRNISVRYREKSRDICSDDNSRLNLFLDLYYSQKIPGQFFWDCCGGMFIKRIEGKQYVNIG